MRIRLQDFADFTTVIQGLVVLSGAGFLAVFAQAFAKAFLGFSVLERAVLGICLFLVILAILLMIIRALRERRTKAEQERDELQEKLAGAEQELKDLRRENEELIGERSIASQPSPPANGLALYPPVEDDELSGPVFTQRTVYIAEFARKAAGVKWRDAVINSRTFTECHVVGPAVLVDMNTGQVNAETFVDCSWDEGADSAWASASLLQRYTGIVGLEDCLFRGCRFTRVGRLVKSPEQTEDEESKGSPKGRLEGTGRAAGGLGFKSLTEFFYR